MATANNPDIRCDIVTLRDLAPAQDVRGGVRRRVFGEETPLAHGQRPDVDKGAHMETPKKPSDQSDSTDQAATQKPLKVNQDTLKDLEPEARDAQHVKGGIPPKLTPGL
jgi:hypothetical protein